MPHATLSYEKVYIYGSHAITLDAVHSVLVAVVVQCLQCNACCTRVVNDWAEENKTCLLAARRVYQLIPFYDLQPKSHAKFSCFQSMWIFV